MPTKPKMLDPIAPGEVLHEEFIAPLGLTINQLARDLDVPPNRISQIVKGKRSITADTALRLSVYFGVSREVWLNLEVAYQLRLAGRLHGEEIRRKVRPRAA